MAAFLFVVGGWFATLVRGRTPQGIHEFLGTYLRYSAWVWSYVSLTSERFPPFTGAAGAYALDVDVDPPARQRRWGVAFRLLLAVPVLILVSLIESILWFAVIYGWFVCLVLGRMPASLENFALLAIRYRTRTAGYLLLLTSRYPALDFPRP